MQISRSIRRVAVAHQHVGVAGVVRIRFTSYVGRFEEVEHFADQQQRRPLSELELLGQPQVK